MKHFKKYGFSEIVQEQKNNPITLDKYVATLSNAKNYRTKIVTGDVVNECISKCAEHIWERFFPK